jgi:ferritin-like metal-binding protein YciE
MTRTVKEELVHFISDMYSVELQAMAQLKTAPESAGAIDLEALFSVHYIETENHAALMRKRLESHDGSPSMVKDAVMKLGGKAFLAFARIMPETPGRLLAHAYAYEAMEWAGYQVLIRIAENAADAQTAEDARLIARQEQKMMLALARNFDIAESLSHADLDQDSLKKHVVRHLTEAHSLEQQSTQLLKRCESAGYNGPLESICRTHLDETRRQAEALEQRLNELGAGPSALKDAALALGGINWRLFFRAQQDSAAKFTAFLYACEHLEIAGYELLWRTADRCHDQTTRRLCESILAEERNTTERLAGAFDSAVVSTFQAAT